MKKEMSGDGKVISKLKRRLLCLNRNLDDRSSSESNNKSSLNEESSSFKFVKTEMSCVKKNAESSSSDCRKTKMSKRGKTNSTVEATRKQTNCNVTENAISQIFRNCPKDKTESNDNQAAQNHNGPSRTDQVINIIAPIEQLSIDSHTAVCDTHMVKLPDTRLLCGGQEIVSYKEFGKLWHLQS